MNTYTNAATRRNDYPAITSSLTSGGRIIYRRTRWSVPLCNAVAALAGLGTRAEG